MDAGKDSDDSSMPLKSLKRTRSLSQFFQYHFRRSNTNIFDSIQHPSHPFKLSQIFHLHTHPNPKPHFQDSFSYPLFPRLMTRNSHGKLVMLGESGAGKTSLINSMSGSLFSAEHTSTIGGQFSTFNIRVSHEVITIDVWDTAGQEVYRSLVEFYVRGAGAAILVTDVTDQLSFGALPMWIAFARTHVPSIQILLFANKCDVEGDWPVDELAKFARENECELFVGSAKTGIAVKEVFERAAGAVRDGGSAPAISSRELEGRSEKKNCC
jgi:small GTP-binding protein